MALPTIVFEAQDAAGADVGTVVVKMDGQLLAEQLTGAAIEVDPGEHVFTFETNGGSTEKRLVIYEAEKNRHERILAYAPAVVVPATPSASANGSVPAAPIGWSPTSPMGWLRSANGRGR